MLNNLLNGRWTSPRPCWPAGSTFRELMLTARDGIKVSAWTGFPESGISSSIGTVIMANGFIAHSRQCGCEEWARDFLKNRYNVVALDFRNHGNSGTRGIPAFGMPESWDFEAALDFASSNYPGPYLLFGCSMAGMAAQLLAQRDARISAAALCITPANPRLALANNPLAKIPFIGDVGRDIWRQVVENAYGADMIAEGDLTKKDMHPLHEPDILYVSGWRDQYGELDTRELFRRWFPCALGYDGEIEENTHTLSGCGSRKFYMLFPAGGHGDKMDWSEISRIVLKFYDRAIKRQKAYGEFISSAASAHSTLMIKSALNNKNLDKILAGDASNAVYRPIPLNDGWFSIQNMQNGKGLGTKPGSTENGADVTERDMCEPADAQAWRPVLCGDACFAIQHKSSKRCLDISMDDCAKLQLWENWFGKNQCWRIHA